MISKDKSGRFLYVLIMFILFTACSKCISDQDINRQDSFAIFNLVDDQTIEVNGEIEDSSLDDFNELIMNYPNMELINIIEILGSQNDDINLALSKQVYSLDIDIRLLDNGEIASGEVDLFLAGRNRSKGSNTRIRVHSWSDGANQASYFHEGDPVHQPYINYYVSVGFSQEEAEDFYYFTINAASAEDIHWMTDEEIKRYTLVN